MHEWQGTGEAVWNCRPVWSSWRCTGRQRVQYTISAFRKTNMSPYSTFSKRKESVHNTRKKKPNRWLTSEFAFRVIWRMSDRFDLLVHIVDVVAESTRPICACKLQVKCPYCSFWHDAMHYGWYYCDNYTCIHSCILTTIPANRISFLSICSH